MAQSVSPLPRSLGLHHPRDAQRDFDKQAEKQKGDLDGDSVILCHTDKVLREGLPHLRGLSVLDARLAEA